MIEKSYIDKDGTPTRLVIEGNREPPDYSTVKGVGYSTELMLWLLEFGADDRAHCGWCGAERIKLYDEPDALGRVSGPGTHKECPAFAALEAARAALGLPDPREGLRNA